MGTAGPNGAEPGPGFAAAGGAYTPGKGAQPDQYSQYSAPPGYPAEYGQAPPGYAQQPVYAQQYAQAAPGYAQQPMPFQVQQAPPPLACGLGLEFVWCVPSPVCTATRLGVDIIPRKSHISQPSSTCSEPLSCLAWLPR